MGLSERQVAEAIGTNLDSYCDIEWHADELCRAVPLSQIKKLSEILGMGLFELVAVQRSFCVDQTPCMEVYRLPRNEQIKKARESTGLSQRQFAERVEFLKVGIKRMERDPDFLDLAAAANIHFQVSEVSFAQSRR